MLLAGVALCRLIYRAWSDDAEVDGEEEDVEAPPPVEIPVNVPCTCACHARDMHQYQCPRPIAPPDALGGRRFRERRLTAY